MACRFGTCTVCPIRYRLEGAPTLAHGFITPSKLAFLTEMMDAMTNLRSMEQNSESWVSPCQVSNDPPNDQGITQLQSCGIKGFSCYDPTELDPTEIVVDFSYELHYNPEMNLEGNILPFLEESMMTYAAATIGLDHCTQAEARSFGDGGRKRRLQIGGIENSRFVGITRNPQDLIDTSVPGCTQGRPIGGLTLSECVPISGGLSVSLSDVNDSLSEDEKVEVEEGVRAFIKDAIDRDMFVSRGNIQKVVFVEQRSGSLGRAIAPDAESNSGSPALSTLWIGLIVGIGALMLLCLLIVFMVHRRKPLAREHKTTRALAEEDEMGLAAVDSLALEPQDLNKSEVTVESGGSYSHRGSPEKETGAAPEPFQHVSVSDDISYIIETETGAEDSTYAPRKIVFPIRSQPPSDVMVFPSSIEDIEDDTSNFSASTPRQALQMS